MKRSINSNLIKSVFSSKNVSNVGRSFSSISSKKFDQAPLKQSNVSGYAPYITTKATDAGEAITGSVTGYTFPDFLKKAAPTRVSTLSNGFRVVTEQRFGETAAVGVFIRAGSRQENKNNNGVAHFLEHMYFKGTPKRTSYDLELEYEDAGAYMNAHTSREYTAFTSHCLKSDVERSIDSLADVLLNSKLETGEIEKERDTILREMQEVNSNINEVLFDNLHSTAFPTSSLGFTILGPEENIKTLSHKDMVEFRKNYYTAENMVLVAVGDVDHEQVVNMAGRYFNKLQRSSESEVTKSAPYVGSDIQLLNYDIPQLHIAIGFEGPGLASADILPLNLLQLMMGSYDASMGAGKYVSSALVSEFARNDWVHSISPFNHAYSDKGLFGVSVTAPGDENTSQMMQQIVRHFARFCYDVNEKELERAKNLLKTSALGSYEGGLPGVLEEVGRQMLFFGRRPSVAEMFARIDAIKVEDIKRVAAKYIYDQDPCVSSLGKTDKCADYNFLRISTYQYKE